MFSVQTIVALPSIISLALQVALISSSGRVLNVFLSVSIVMLFISSATDLLFSDLFFGLPTIIKTYKDPSSETRFPWVMTTLSGLTSLFALRNFGFLEAVYPVYLFVYDSTVLLIVLKFIKKGTHHRKGSSS